MTHILVAYRGGSYEDELLRMGCRVAREARARLSVIHVIEVPMWLELNAPDLPGAQGAEVLMEHCDEVGSEIGVSVNAETIHARDAACAIIDHAKSMGVDLIFVGAGKPGRGGRVGLSRTPEFVLAHSPCAVVVGQFPERSNGG